MSNLMASFGIGVSGLRVSQTSINTTAHNLSNVDTDGYVRQQPVQTDFSYINLGQTAYNTKQSGLGADMQAIRQVRDVFLDKAYRLESGRGGFYDAAYEAESEIETLFGEMNGVSFKNSLEEFWSNLQELVKEPDSIVKRANIVQTGVAFIERAENIANQISAYQSDLNTQIRNVVDQVNAYGDRLYELNTMIVSKEINGENANDYRDERNYILDELGHLGNITYKETVDGTVTVNFEKMQFVTEGNVAHLGTEKISEGSEMIKVVWEGYGGIDAYPSYKALKEKVDEETGEVEQEEVKYVYLNTSTADNTDVGYLKGLVISRGNYRANYTDIPVMPVEEDYQDEDGVLDQEAYEEAMKLYDRKVEDYNKSIQGSIVMTVQAQFDQLIHSVVTAINDVLSPNADISTYVEHLNLEGVTAEDAEGCTISYTDAYGNDITLSGEDLNGVLVWDEGIAPLGMDENQTPREALFNRKGMDRYIEGTIQLPDGSEKAVYIYNQEDVKDNYSLFTLGEIEINPELLQDYSKLPLNGNEYVGLVGAYDVRTCNKLLEIWDNVTVLLDPNTLTTSNFKDYYNSFIENLAIRGEEIYNISTNQEKMVDQINTSRQNVIGVSSDDELTNLIKYQHAYNANARYVNVISQMLEHIIERLG